MPGATPNPGAGRWAMSGQRSDGHAAVRQQTQHLRVATAFLADQVFDRYPHVIEEDRRVGRAAPARGQDAKLGQADRGGQIAARADRQRHALGERDDLRQKAAVEQHEGSVVVKRLEAVFLVEPDQVIGIRGDHIAVLTGTPAPRDLDEARVDVDPDAFGAWGFEALLHDRLPRYQALADNFGYVVEAADLATVRDGDEFLDLVAGAIGKRMR